MCCCAQHDTDITFLSVHCMLVSYLNKLIIVQSLLHISVGNVVFSSQDLNEIPMGSPPRRTSNVGGKIELHFLSI